MKKSIGVKSLFNSAMAAAILSLAGCVHVEIFHPDVAGTYHLGADRPFWSYEGQVRHVRLATPVEPLAQETPTWCWAASCQMLLASQGIKMSQSEIVRRAYGDAREAGGKSPLIIELLSSTFTIVNGKKVKLQAHRADGFPKNGLELVASIEDGMPFIVDIGYYKDGKVKPGEAYAAHSLLVYGLTYQREGNNVHVLSLDVLDPSYVMIEQTEPDYHAAQRMDERLFDTIQGTVGVYRK
jgi:hypothetical protein